LISQFVVDRLGEAAERRGIPRATLALAWGPSKPAITSPIVGATKPNHLTDAVAALQVKLAAEEIASLEEPYVARPMVGFS
jgi:1-deoxyxylulose-5-phosphate synthase